MTNHHVRQRLDSYWASKGPSDQEMIAAGRAAAAVQAEQRRTGEGLQQQRLTLLDALTPEGADQDAGMVDWCGWDLPIAGLSEIQRHARRLHNLLLAECSKWEVEQGF